MIKRILAFSLTLIMIMSLMAACNSAPATNGGNSTNTQNNGTTPIVGNFAVPENGYDGSDVTITFYHTMGQALRDVLEAYIVEFNKLYPNIHIVHSQVGGYDDVRDQISTEITVGSQPNIAYCYPDHVAIYNIASAVATLDELIASKINVTRADGTTESQV